jgi:hypothetical protein
MKYITQWPKVMFDFYSLGVLTHCLTPAVLGISNHQPINRLRGRTEA